MQSLDKEPCENAERQQVAEGNVDSLSCCHANFNSINAQKCSLNNTLHLSCKKQNIEEGIIE